MKSIRVRNYRVITLSLLLGLSLVGLSLLLARPPVVKAGTITVTSDADDGPGTLRRAILNAFPNDTINFAPGLTTVNLTTSELVINKNLTISGPGANVLTVQRSFFGPIPNFRVFHMVHVPASPPPAVTISGLTITNGNDGGGGGGGGILNDGGSLTLTGCAISTNTAELGGGIFNSLSSTITITNSSISGNTATGRFNGGGGIVNAIGGMVTITNSTISDNSTNQATLGGGIENFETVNLINSTISGNTAADGGAIYNVNNTPVNLTNCTISNNSANLAAASGGINNHGTVNARNTIIARNKNPGNGSGADFKGTLLSQGFNLIGNPSGATITGTTTGNQTSVDPNLGDLGDNGGPTQTQALLPGSPAIDKGGAATGVTTDQRGLPRPSDDPAIPNASGGDGSDIGAFEVQSTPTPQPDLVISKGHVGTNFTQGQNGAQYTLTVVNGGNTATTGTITVTDPLPAGLTFASGSGTGWSCGAAGQAVTCTNAGTPIAAGGTSIITLNVNVAVNAAASLNNSATTACTCTESNTSNNTSNTDTVTVTPTPTTIQFSASLYVVGEGDGRVNVTVTRSGNTSGASSVGFATSDSAGSQNCNVFNGNASSRCDYLTSIGTVQFAAGETSRTFSIPIIDDSYAEGNETFTVSLNNASDASLGTQATTTVMIVDNETTTGPNPIDQSSFYVRQHYLDFLNREPDTSGLNFWINNIESCGADANCRTVKRIDTSAAFFLSIEFQQTGYLVERIYKASYGDAIGTSTFGGTHQLSVPIVRLNEFLPDTQEIGRGVVVGQGNWQQQLENNKQAFTSEFVQRSRFIAAFATSMTPAQFVDKLFLNAGMTPSGSDRTVAINEFGSATTTVDVAMRSRALRDVAENATLNQQEFNRAFVLMQFLGYLRRNPNDAPDADYTGYDFWLTKLNQFNGNFGNAEMVKAFISSGEYRNRFGP